MVAADLDVGGDEIRDGGIGSPEHEVLSRPFEVVVDDLVGTGAVPTRDRLRVRSHFVEIGKVAVHHGHPGPVHGKAAPDAAGGSAMHIAAVEDDVGGHLTQ
jgi:hypothetical protein